MRPDHVSGCRARTRDVVHATNHDILRPELVEQLLHFGDDRFAIVRETLGIGASAEHRPHGVPDHSVEIARLWPRTHPWVCRPSTRPGVLCLAHRFSLMCPT